MLLLLVNGKAGKQIAAELDISYKTMEKIRSRMMQKMEAGSVAELVVMAIQLKVITSCDWPGTSGDTR